MRSSPPLWPAAAKSRADPAVRWWSRLWVLSLAVILIMLAPRLPSVGQLGYLQAQWWLRSPRFIEALSRGQFEQTFQSPHPGVTTMWLLGSTLWLGERMAGPLRPPQQLWIIDLVQVLWSSALTVVLFCILRRVLIEYGAGVGTASWTAWLACAVLALDPVWLTFTQVVSLDPPMTALAMIAVLLTLSALSTGSIAAMVGAGSAIALATLTKL